MGRGLLGNGQNGHQNKEDNSLCLGNAVPILIDVVGGVNVQRQQLGLVELRAILDDAGQTAGQRQVLVEQLEGVGQGQEGITLGMMTLNSVWLPLAPSISAASSMSPGTA